MKLTISAVGLLLLAGAAGVEAQPIDSLGQRLAPLTSSLVVQNQRAESELRLVARIEVQPNEIFEVYEPSPGKLLLSAAGAPSAPSRLSTLEVKGRSFVDIWNQVADGRPMPKALRAALQRSQVPPRGGPQKESEPAGGSGGGAPFAAPPASPIASGEKGDPNALAGGYCDNGWFNDGWSSCYGGFQICVDNWSGGAYAWHTEIYSLRTNVCAAQGNVAFRIRSDEGFGGFWSVPQDTYRWYHYLDAWCDLVPWNDCPYIRADVEDAWGDRFHFRFNALIS